MRYFLLALCVSMLGNTKPIEGNDPYCDYCQPEQIHIAFGEKTNDIVITWTSQKDPSESRVQFGHRTMDREVRGNRTEALDLRGQWIHRVTLPDLEFNTTYNYRCGSQYGWSERFEFTTLPAQPTVLRAAIYGDMGVENAHSLPYLQRETEDDKFDFILHVGDFGYDMDDNESRVGDQFMNQIQPFAALVPYMVCPGNHENDRNFTQFKNRMTMPQHKQWESMFYSWDVGPIHFVSINTEAYYFRSAEFGNGSLVYQFDWLVRDLETANLKENRHKRPWIIMYGHRPMYCSDSDDVRECDHELTRVGVSLDGYNQTFAIEPLLMKYGVDIVIWAHEHTYERTWPLYDYKLYNGSTEHPYRNPGAPIHLVTGSAGCKEEHDQFNNEQPYWSAYRSIDYGYTRFYAHNHTHLYFEQVSVELGGDVIDSFWVEQQNHGPFPTN